jgi:hypothetical protein
MEYGDMPVFGPAALCNISNTNKDKSNPAQSRPGFLFTNKKNKNHDNFLFNCHKKMTFL